MHVLLLSLLACQTPEPEPPPEPVVVEPEPELPKLSDGTEIQPCDAEVEGLGCVPGGSFTRGGDEKVTCPETEVVRYGVQFGPSVTVEMPTFYMDVTEVTYEAYKACEAEGLCNKAGPLYSDYDRPQQPIVGISWYDAVQFCEAMGKHLPTESEWEKAARGPDGAAYPWGDEPTTCERAVIRDPMTGRSCGIQKKGGNADKGRTWEVAQKEPGIYGLYDMVGNAEEWVADWYGPYDECGEACTGVDPKGPCDGQEPCEGFDRKMVKGGSWFWPASCAVAYHRRPHFPANKPYHHFGFRCAASVDEARALAAGFDPYADIDEAPAGEEAPVEEEAAGQP